MGDLLAMRPAHQDPGYLHVLSAEIVVTNEQFNLFHQPLMDDNDAIVDG
jgi:hypothetical protein